MDRDPDNRRGCTAACSPCAVACGRGAGACLQEEDVRMMSQCIALDLDGAAVYRLAAATTARDRRAAVDVGRMCGSVCDAGGAECGRPPAEPCRQCRTTTPA